MSALRHVALVFSATPSSLRAGLLGFGLAFAATDPGVAVAGKATAPVAPAAVHARLSGRLIPATPEFDSALVPRPHQPNRADFPA